MRSVTAPLWSVLTVNALFGSGRWPQLPPREQVLLSVIWLRLYPTQEVLGFLFGVSDTNVLRTLRSILSLLEAAGRDTPCVLLPRVPANGVVL